jgi:acyl dehydratase
MLPEIGRVVTGRRNFTQDDFDRFADLSGDDNPIHVDPDFASTTRFGSTVAHGMLLYGVICGVLSEHFPGSSQIEQRLMFVAPTFAGEEVTTHVEVVDVDDDNHLFKLAVVMSATDGKIVCDGETTLRWSER